jgi:NADH-quinone oxidoreductase subunit N
MEVTLTHTDFKAIYPVISMAAFLIGVLILDLFGKKGETGLTAFAAFVAAAFTGVLCFRLWNSNISGFGGMAVLDNYAVFFDIIFLTALALTVLLSGAYLRNEDINHGEYYVLLIGAVIGMMVMASAGNLLMVFLGIETLSISLYVLAGFARRKLVSNEAALKYLLLGAFATGFLLFGIALVYGSTGTLDLGGIAGFLSKEKITPLFLVGIILMLVGFGFKASLVPFHFWAPDVYQGAPTPVTGFMATAAKAAAFAVFFRVFMTALPAAREHWNGILWVIAVLTMTVGNVTAVSQTNIKRMLAYSSIAHAGYILVAIVAGGAAGNAAVLFYLLAYTFMNIGAFGVISAMGRKGQVNETLSGFAGISVRYPILSALMVVFMLSLAGIPPTAGFMGKLYIFTAAVRAGQTPLVIIGVLNAVISVFYYLRVVVVMYMSEPEAELPHAPTSVFTAAALLVCAVAIFLIGIMPSTIIEAVQQSVFQLPY